MSTGQPDSGSSQSGQHFQNEQNTGSFFGEHPAGFFTENQAAGGQIYAESITAAHISNPTAGSVRARQVHAAFINSCQESDNPPPSITAGRVQARSIIIRPSTPVGFIIAGELRADFIGPSKSSAEVTEQTQDVQDSPKDKGQQ